MRRSWCSAFVVELRILFCPLNVMFRLLVSLFFVYRSKRRGRRTSAGGDSVSRLVTKVRYVKLISGRIVSVIHTALGTA